MKVFKFNVGEDYYAVSGKTRKAALEYLLDDMSIEEKDITSEEEIPKEKWDEKFISVWEDNDTSKKPFKISINDAIDNK